jgi:GNAT superfamily N-acetyltransferase
MVRNPDQAEFLRQGRLWYPEGTAPFGELNLVRIDHTMTYDQQGQLRGPSATLYTQTARTICNAWANSDWLQRDLTQQGQPDLYAEFKLSRNLKPGIDGFVMKAALYPDKYSAWFAVRPPEGQLDEGEPLVKGLGRSASLDQVVGMATAKHDVSGNLLRRAVKRLRHPEKVYAKVGDVAVFPLEQGKKIGTALDYAALKLFGPDQHPTKYVAASNQRLIEHLEGLGYQQAGSHPRTDFVDGITIDEVRLEASSVREVRGNMIERNDWLPAARVVNEPYNHI